MFRKFFLFIILTLLLTACSDKESVEKGEKTLKFLPKVGESLNIDYVNQYNKGDVEIGIVKNETVVWKQIGTVNKNNWNLPTKGTTKVNGIRYDATTKTAYVTQLKRGRSEYPIYEIVLPKSNKVYKPKIAIQRIVGKVEFMKIGEKKKVNYVKFNQSVFEKKEELSYDVGIKQKNGSVIWHSLGRTELKKFSGNVDTKYSSIVMVKVKGYLDKPYLERIKNQKKYKNDKQEYATFVLYLPKKQQLIGGTKKYLVTCNAGHSTCLEKRTSKMIYNPISY